MSRLRVIDADTGALLGHRIGHARRWWQRLVGLLPRTELAAGEGLLLDPCRAVHMHFMRLSLDVAVLDAERRVVAVHPALPPGGRTPWRRDARYILELPVGTLDLAGITPGSRLAWTRAPEQDHAA